MATPRTPGGAGLMPDRATPRNQDDRRDVARKFERAEFIGNIGLQLVDCGPGCCESEFRVCDKHRLQDGFVHACVQVTVADRTSGAAAATSTGSGRIVLPVEFKINLLRPGVGTRISCRSRVLRPGKNLSVSEPWLHGWGEGSRTWISKAAVTLALGRRA